MLRPVATTLTENNDYRKDVADGLGNGFLQRGPEQAASEHTGTYFSAEPALASSSFSLDRRSATCGMNLVNIPSGKLDEEYPNHPMALKATRSLEAILR